MKITVCKNCGARYVNESNYEETEVWVHPSNECKNGEPKEVEWGN